MALVHSEEKGKKELGTSKCRRENKKGWGKCSIIEYQQETLHPQCGPVWQLSCQWAGILFWSPGLCCSCQEESQLWQSLFLTGTPVNEELGWEPTQFISLRQLSTVHNCRSYQPGLVLNPWSEGAGLHIARPWWSLASLKQHSNAYI